MYFDTAVTGWAGGNVRGSLGVKVCVLRMPSVRSQNNGREPKEVSLCWRVGKMMPQPQADAIRLGYLIAAALQSARGRQEIQAAERRLLDLIVRGRFHSARAVKVYATAVDNAVGRP